MTAAGRGTGVIFCRGSVVGAARRCTARLEAADTVVRGILRPDTRTMRPAGQCSRGLYGATPPVQALGRLAHVAPRAAFVLRLGGATTDRSLVFPQHGLQPFFPLLDKMQPIETLASL